MSRHIYTMKTPAGWHKELWREALPLGNGLTGALVPGAIGTEQITLTRHDLWEGGTECTIPDVSDTIRAMREAIERGDYAAANQENLGRALQQKGGATPIACPHPLGWLEISFAPERLFKSYRRGVNMQTGEAFVEFSVDGCRYRRTAFVSRKHDVLVMHVCADRPFTATYSLRLYNKEVQSVTNASGLYRASADGYSASRVRFAGDCSICVKQDALEVTGADYTVLIRCASHGSDDSLDCLAGQSYDQLLAGHVALHRALYDSASIELADDAAFDATNEQMLSDAYQGEASCALLERLWRFGRYLFISAASEHGNPVPLYGIWPAEPRLAWSQYVANENVEITYWHAVAGGLSYAILPLLRYYTARLEKLRECARSMFGTRGIWISAYTAPDSFGASVPVAVILNWTGCAGWLCRHFWEYYLYTGDKQLLADEILPFMHEAALFYLDFAQKDGEHICLFPSVSPENIPKGAPGVVARNATMDFAILKELLTNLLCGMEITGLYADEREQISALLAKIPPYMINGDGAIKEWMDPAIRDNYHHRHLSHIYPVFPGNEVSAHSHPALFEAFKQAVRLRKLGAQSGWSLAHMASIYARMGEGERSVECLDVMTKSVIMQSLMTTHNDWRRMGVTLEWEGEAFVQLDAAFGIVNALQEMLFCAQKGALSILPALPARLESGDVRGLVFPEGRVDIAWDKDGQVTLTVHATRALDTSILLRGCEVCRLTLKAGQSRTLSL